jgi:fermentation-respiration switch protein FrsA (DUF1100 family)
MLKILIYLAFFYVILTVSVFFFANTLIFPKPVTGYRDTKQIIKLTTRDGALISAIHLPNPEATYTLLVSHGNAEDLGHMFPFLQALQREGFAVFAYDYHGYGTSEGSPTETHVYNDVQAAYQYVTQELHVSPQHIISFGRSLGSAAAIYLAAQKPTAALIIQSPFLSAFRVITALPLLPFDRFNNLKLIKKVHCPILVIHGMQDRVIPFWQGKVIYRRANPPKQFFWIKGAGHNNVLQVAGQRYFEAIKTFVVELVNKNKIHTHVKPLSENQ